MQIKEWKPSTLIETSKVFLLRSTIHNRGPKIGKHGLLGTSYYEVDRRKSVIEVVDNQVWFIIGAVAYGKTGFDSADPLEPLRMFATDQFKVLYRVKFNGTINEALEQWNGSFNILKTLDTTPKVL